MEADKKRANEAPASRKPVSAQDIKATSSESTVGLELMALLEVHKKKLVIVAGVLVAAVVVMVIYDHYVKQRELNAGAALLALRPPIGSDRAQPVPAEKYMQIVADYSGTATANLTIQVSEEAARAFAQVSPEDQRKIQLLLDLRLRDLTISPLPRKSLQAVMDEIGKNAAARGLTPAVLESLLNDG